MNALSPEAEAVIEKIGRSIEDADRLPDYWQDWGQKKVGFLLQMSVTIQETGRVSKRQKEVATEIHIQIGDKF